MPKNNLDYENFVARMGSFDDNFDDLFPDELTHMANKSITIKEATDKELDELLIRLRKENELQKIIFELKRKSNTNGFIPYDYPGISTESPIESLYHFGVLGMRWGRRRGKTGSLKKSVSDRITKYNDHRNNSSDDYKKNVDLKKKRINELSNAELKSLNERLQLERNYKDLSAKDVSKGRKFAQEILREVTKEIIKENVKDTMKTGIKRVTDIKRVF